MPYYFYSMKIIINKHIIIICNEVNIMKIIDILKNSILFNYHYLLDLWATDFSLYFMQFELNRLLLAPYIIFTYYYLDLILIKVNLLLFALTKTIKAVSLWLEREV